ATDLVFRDIYPDWKTFARDLKRAGIQNVGDPNGKVHFHSLRHTLNHRLQDNGVVPTVAQHLMRHSDINLTTRTYINSASLPLVEAIQKVPSIGKKRDASEVLNTPLDTHLLVPAGHLVSQTVREFSKNEFLKYLQETDLSPDLTLLVTTCQNTEKVGRTGFEPVKT
ncbi:MAG TPA: tyrosine-type recombinase/integrase, partial [Candidatus Methylacidiphilales bacterium]|nr:tyrosine-type recombinase/integrase [Candidatus Methylacidiphilales bacterium]